VQVQEAGDPKGKTCQSFDTKQQAAKLALAVKHVSQQMPFAIAMLAVVAAPIPQQRQHFYSCDRHCCFLLLWW
jgi:hypothetical protein